MVPTLIPTALQNLTFDQCIYALAFHLENDLQHSGTQIFNQLLHPECMSTNVETLLYELINIPEAHALQVVLGSTELDNEKLGFYHSIPEAFGGACRILQQGDCLHPHSLILEGLLGESRPWTETPRFTATPRTGTSDQTALLTEIRDATLRIEQLIRASLNPHISEEALAQLLQTPPLTPDPPSAQVQTFEFAEIVWPCYARPIFDALSIRTLEDLYAYFGDPINLFDTDHSIRPLDYLAIRQILRDHGVIQPLSEKPLSLDTPLHNLRLPSRVIRSLNNHRHVVRDARMFFNIFNDDPAAGLTFIRNLYNCGAKSYEETICAFSSVEWDIPRELIFPHADSDIYALRLNCKDYPALCHNAIWTLNHLQQAMTTTNPFYSLARNYSSLYNTVKARLDLYAPA